MRKTPVPSIASTHFLRLYDLRDLGFARGKLSYRERRRKRLYKILTFPLQLKCCTQYTGKFGKFSSGHRTGKGIFIPTPKKGNAKTSKQTNKVLHNGTFSNARKVMLKILEYQTSPYVNRELLDVQIGFRKGRGTRDQIANIVRS